MALELVIDYTVNKIIQEIQNTYKKKDGTRLEYGTVVKILESQLENIRQGIIDGNIVVVKYLGTFKVNPKRVYALNKKYSVIGKKPTLLDTGFDNRVVKFTKSKVEVNEEVGHI